MITLFVCTKTTCPNSGIVYRMEDSDTTAMCGGCGDTLTGTPETKEN